VSYERLRTDGLGGETLGELELDDTPAPPIPAWAKGICRVLTLEKGEGPLRLPPLVVPALKGWRALMDGRRMGKGVGDEGRSASVVHNLRLRYGSRAIYASAAKFIRVAYANHAPPRRHTPGCS
jgi:hypothetical protein